MNPESELQVHLDMLEIDNEMDEVGNVVICNASKLLAHLTDEAFIARQPFIRESVPTPIVDGVNPVGALQEWAIKSNVAVFYTNSDNIGTVQNPRFQCGAKCTNGLFVTAEGPSKSIAKRKAAQLLLEKLAELTKRIR